MKHDVAVVTAAVFERVANGESLRSVCRDPAMTAIGTVMKWIANDSQLQEQYARARSMGLDAMAEEILEIADDGRNDWMLRHDKDNEGWQFNGEHSQRSKLRIESRKWLLAKMAPKKYGDRVELVDSRSNDPHDLPTAELEALVAQQRQTLQLEEDGTVSVGGGGTSDSNGPGV